VAGETGTLAARMRGTAAAGNCQAKTGTLSDASDLAGWCDDRYVFAILINHCSLWRAQRAEDVIVEAIAKLAAPATAKPAKQPRR
jgi:D-alanyl-D-alanine carboxypeptidase/D-alanyl-D-alanine-endopeptidase (penicillin-binding protein 4)